MVVTTSLIVLFVVVAGSVWVRPRESLYYRSDFVDLLANYDNFGIILSILEPQRRRKMKKLVLVFVVLMGLVGCSFGETPPPIPTPPPTKRPFGLLPGETPAPTPVITPGAVGACGVSG